MIIIDIITPLNPAIAQPINNMTIINKHPKKSSVLELSSFLLLSDISEFIIDSSKFNFFCE